MSGPGFSQDLRQRQTQSLVLAPQLRQSLKILQVAALELRTVIQEELQANPTLEELPMDGESLDRTTDEHETQASAEERAELDSDSASPAPTDDSPWPPLAEPNPTPPKTPNAANTSLTPWSPPPRSKNT